MSSAKQAGEARAESRAYLAMPPIPHAGPLPKRPSDKCFSFFLTCCFGQQLAPKDYIGMKEVEPTQKNTENLKKL